MQFTQYIEEVKKRELRDYEDPITRASEEGSMRLIHAAMGVCTEGSELLDALKKSIFYGKKLDQVNMLEEVGDCLWYLALICDELGFDFNEAMERNVAKLKLRYKEKFTSAEAINRNTKKEHETLSKSGVFKPTIDHMATKFEGYSS